LLLEDFLYVEGEGIQSVRLYFMEGELILNEKPGAATRIDFRNRKPGIYYLQYERNDRNTGLLKIVRKK
jgi:hypothetical protein